MAYSEKTAMPVVVVSDRSSSSTPLANMVTSIHRYVAADSPKTIAAGALSVEILVIAATVTLGGVSLPANTALTIGQDGFGTPALALTISGSGDVLVIENRVS